MKCRGRINQLKVTQLRSQKSKNKTLTRPSPYLWVLCIPLPTPSNTPSPPLPLPISVSSHLTFSSTGYSLPHGSLHLLPSYLGSSFLFSSPSYSYLSFRYPFIFRYPGVPSLLRYDGNVINAQSHGTLLGSTYSWNLYIHWDLLEVGSVSLSWPSGLWGQWPPQGGYFPLWPKLWPSTWHLPGVYQRFNK